MDSQIIRLAECYGHHVQNDFTAFNFRFWMPFPISKHQNNKNYESQ